VGRGVSAAPRSVADDLLSMRDDDGDLTMKEPDVSHAPALQDDVDIGGMQDDLPLNIGDDDMLPLGRPSMAEEDTNVFAHDEGDKGDKEAATHPEPRSSVAPEAETVIRNLDVSDYAPFIELAPEEDEVQAPKAARKR